MILQLIFHILACFLTGFDIFYEFKYVNFPPSEFQWHHSFGGKFKFLSVQNLFIQFWYFFLAFVHDLTSEYVDNKSINQLSIFIDHYFTGLVFPLAIFVSLNFWGLYLTKRDKVYPQVFANSVPIWHLHSLHTNVTLLALMEMFLCYHAFPELCCGLITIISFVSTYILWLCSIKYFAGFWVYPLLNEKSFKELCKYFGSALLQMIIIYMLGEILNSAVWSQELIHKNCVKHQ